MNQKSFWAGVVILFLLGFFIKESYIYHVLILCFIWTIVVVGWDLVLGYCGILNFAQLVFFAAAAYITGMLSLNLGIHPILAFLLSAVFTGFIGFLVGLPCLRLRGEYVALFTFAIHLALPAIISQGRSILYAHYVSVVTPKILGNEFFLMVMLMLSVGGTGKFPGVVLGAFIITIGNEVLRDAGQYRLLILGICVVLTILYLPNGIVQLRDRLNIKKNGIKFRIN